MEVEMKTEKCNSCKTMRTPSDFIYKQKVNKTCGYCWDNRKKNKEKESERKKKYYEANKDKYKEYREANKDKRKEYYEANKEKINEKKKEFKNKLKQENPLLYKVKEMVCHSRGGDIKNNRYNETNYVDIDHLFKLMEIQAGCCVYCGIEMLVDDFTHSKDGVSIQRINNSLGHNKNNCVMSCFGCNVSNMEAGVPADFYQHILDEL